VKDVFLGLGTNLGDRMENLRKAIAMLEPHMQIEKRSSIYESVPLGVEDEQPLYLNMVLHGTTPHDPHTLLRELKQIEANMGRAVDSHKAPRPIDLDILLYGDQVIEVPGLAIPHREMHTRAFVLVPLEEIAAFHMHPVLEKPVIDLLDELGGYSTIVRIFEEQL
jgi:2-amino-4-hydroxy-6-hydroxymethyldihydropteridine diphosphokinase